MTDIAIVQCIVAGFIALYFYTRACRSLIRRLDGEGRK